MGRTPIDLKRARRQHHAYEVALASLGCEVRRLPDADDLPDAVFVQDAALVFDEVAVIARPGAAARRPETASVAAALAPYGPLRFIEAPATLDGGDVVCIGKRIFVGQTARTNADGARQLADILTPFGYTVLPVAPTGCLHLQTAITPVADGVVLVNRAWVDPAVFGGVEIINVDPSEPLAANALRVGDALIFSDCFPKTRARLEARGLQIVSVDTTELAKAEAGVTCCCLLVP
ncbi:MAG TPA: N(G),N(G)-dimethylarginine dimethylaminohydrolase [Gemmataceae bacterium]|nr:N(G),N(G)-dimethylarginine dimethylaminohydrolase [Gemmataceae bacterium]